MPEQVIIVDEKGRRPRLDQLDKEKLDALSKLLDKLPDIIPYLAAFGYGYISGYNLTKQHMTGLQLGCASTLLFDLARTLPSNALVPSPTQIFAVGGLTAIGLAAPIKTWFETVWKGITKAAEVQGAEVSRIMDAPIEDKPHYDEWMAYYGIESIAGRAAKLYCDWMKEYYPNVRAKVCEV